MGKQYQTRDATASTPGLAIPEKVSVALAEIVESAKEGLLALAVGAGLQVLGTLMEESVTALAGPKGKHHPDRVAVRHGHEQGSVTLGGRRVGVQRPRVRAADGSGELPVAAYELFSGTELLGRLALERMLHGLSTRRYPVGLEPVGTQVEQAATGTSKSAVSRRFVAMTHTALAELLAADLSGLDLVCLLIDGVHFGEHTCVVALGIAIDGTKHPLALVEGATENTTLARDLITGLRERGLDTSRPILVVIDGAKALRRAILDLFDHPVLARCQQHKIRNVRDKLPQRLGGPVEHRMRTAYHAASALDAQAQLTTLARELDKTHPGAAASLREGLAETLTVLRLGVPPTLARTLRSTNTIESMISICRDHAGNVKRWQDGTMALLGRPRPGRAPVSPPAWPERVQPAAQGCGAADDAALRWLAAQTPGSAELLRLLDGTPVGCGQSTITVKRSGLFGYAGYGYEPSHSRYYWGVRLLLICTAEGTVTGFGLANPKLVGEREAVRQLLGGQPAYRPPRGSAVVTDKGLAGQETRAFFADLGLHLVRPARTDEPDLGLFPKWLRQRVEAIIWTLKHQLGLEHHGGRVPAGLWARIVQRLLALNTVIWHNWTIGAPVKRSLIAYDH